MLTEEDDARAQMNDQFPAAFYLPEITMKLMAKVPVYLGALLAFLIAPAQAAVEVNLKQDITLSTFVPCAAGGVGEVVDLSGPLHVLLSFTITANNVSGVMHFQPQGIDGTGETTGDKYQATGVTSTSFTQSLVNGKATETFIDRFDIIGQGPGNNYSVHETAHLTINANGTVTVIFDDLTVTCH